MFQRVQYKCLLVFSFVWAGFLGFQDHAGGRAHTGEGRWGDFLGVDVVVFQPQCHQSGVPTVARVTDTFIRDTPER